MKEEESNEPCLMVGAEKPDHREAYNRNVKNCEELDFTHLAR